MSRPHTILTTAALAAMLVAGAACGGTDRARAGATAPRGAPVAAIPAGSPARARGPRVGPVALPGQEQGIAWIARITRPVLGRSSPSVTAPGWAHIDGRTRYSGRRNGLRVTGAFRDRDGRVWLRVLLAYRPNGTTAWVPRSQVRLTATDLSVRVSLASHRLEVWRGGRRIAGWRAGIGRPGTPTPPGSFSIEDLVVTPAGAEDTYGPYILTLTAHSGVLHEFDGGDGQSAIHGVGDPSRVGRPSSFGCVVLGDAPLRRLFRMLRPGTPVEISPR